MKSMSTKAQLIYGTKFLLVLIIGVRGLIEFHFSTYSSRLMWVEVGYRIKYVQAIPGGIPKHWGLKELEAYHERRTKKVNRTVYLKDYPHSNSRLY